MKNLNPAVGIRMMLEEPDVQNWLKYHLKRDQEITGVQMDDPGDFYYKLVAMSERAALNPIARRHLYVSMLWYINGDQDELPKREAEALHQFRSVLNYVEQLQQADHYIERYSTRFPDQAKEAEVAGQRMENILVLNENIDVLVAKMQDMQLRMTTMQQERRMHLAADSFQQNRCLLDGRQPTEFTREEAMKLMPTNAWMCLVCERAQPEGMFCVYCDKPRKETGFITYPSLGEPSKVVDAELPTVFHQLDRNEKNTKRMRQQKKKHSQAMQSMQNYLKPENHPWMCQHVNVLVHSVSQY